MSGPSVGEREAFERLASALGHRNFSRVADAYCNSQLRDFHMFWQASRAELLSQMEKAEVVALPFPQKLTMASGKRAEERLYDEDQMIAYGKAVAAALTPPTPATQDAQGDGE